MLEWELPLKIVALAEEPAQQAAKARAMLPPGAAHVVAAEMHIELTLAGEGVAVQNARDELKKVANRVSKWTNDEDAVARPWL
eukprot:Skav220097  [mRNA]  locus=scaffold1991:100369:102132:- [translate_table: standard]